jgi:hypothetical protein
MVAVGADDDDDDGDGVPLGRGGGGGDGWEHRVRMLLSKRCSAPANTCASASRAHPSGGARRRSGR